MAFLRKIEPFRWDLGPRLRAMLINQNIRILDKQVEKVRKNLENHIKSKGVTK